MQDAHKWYQKPIGIILLLVLFFPIGLYLMWKHAGWSPKIKWGITGFFAFMVLISAVTSGTSTPTTEQQAAEPTKPKVEQPVTPPPAPPQPLEQPAPVKISIDALVAGYDANKLAAEEKYKDKTLEVSGGVIRNISTDVFGTPFISLEPKKEFYFGTSVKCDFKRENKDKLLLLKNGQALTVIGLNEGMTIGIITLSDCRF